MTVLLSVAFVVGSLIFSDTVGRTFDRLFASTAADVTVTPKESFDETIPSGRTPTLPAALAGRLARVDGVAAARAEVDVDGITVVDADRERVSPTSGAPTLAAVWNPTDRSPVELTSGHAPRGDGQVMLDADTADRTDVRVGDRLTVIGPRGSFPVRVVGIATFTTTNPGAALVFFDTATAQKRLLGDPDAATSVSVDAADGVPDPELKRRVAQALGADADAYELRTADEQAKSDVERLGTFLDVIKYVMLGFAGVAVLVGVFLIVNTFSMLIAQRTRELGLLRALGADRRQVRRSVLTEALLLGLFGSTAGLAAGIGLAIGLIELMGLLGMRIRTGEMVIGWGTPVAAYVVGLGVTFVASYLPARRAAGVSPMAALADAEIADVGRPLRAAGLEPGEDRVGLLAERAAAGDEDVRGALREAGTALGIALTGAVNLLDPRTVVLGGALAALAPWLLPSLESELDRRTAGPACPVSVSRLGPEGPLLGAAHAVVRAVLDDPASVAKRA
ncbi:ROK family protein [Streptomyces nigra]